MGASDLISEYEKRYPEVGIPDAQKQERMERLLHREERQSLRRTGRTRGLIVPALPVDEHGRLKP